MTTILVIIVALAAALWVSAPFWFKRDRHLATVNPDFKSFRRAEALRSQLRDLEFDHASGKVDDEEYSEMQSSVTERLQAAGREEVLPVETMPLEYSHQLVEVEAEAEILIARVRRQLASSWECGACGRRMNSSDRFCASCGKARETGL